MSKSAKRWLIVAASFVAIGAIMFVVVMTMNNWKISLLSSEHFDTNTFEIREEFSNIKINSETADIYFEVSDDNICRVDLYDDEKMNHSASVQNDTLTINMMDDRKWYERIGFSFQTPKITVYLPKTEYDSLIIQESTGEITLPKDFTFGSMDLIVSTGNVDCSASTTGEMCIECSTGDIHLQRLSAEKIDLMVSTGYVDVLSVSCDSFNSVGSTGYITLKDTIVKGKMSVERSTGDVKLNGCDAEELEIHTETGDITGSLLSSKVFVAESDTGETDVPETISGGRCKVTTSTGDISITIE